MGGFTLEATQGMDSCVGFVSGNSKIILDSTMGSTNWPTCHPLRFMTIYPGGLISQVWYSLHCLKRTVPKDSFVVKLTWGNGKLSNLFVIYPLYYHHIICISSLLKSTIPGGSREEWYVYIYIYTYIYIHIVVTPKTHYATAERRLDTYKLYCNLLVVALPSNQRQSALQGRQMPIQVYYSLSLEWRTPFWKLSHPIKESHPKSCQLITLW